MCSRCGSSNQTEFNSEICLHPPRKKDLTKAPAMIFPGLTVCLDCGLAQFDFPKEELLATAER
jgi:hypothetical protein